MDEVIVDLHEGYEYGKCTGVGIGEAERCLSTVNKKLDMFHESALNFSSSVCIYKLPENYRNQNDKAFTPRLVSMGFIHHRDTQVQAMEEYKIKYLHNFFHSFNVSLSDLVKYVNDQCKLVYSCYDDRDIRSLPEGKVPLEVILLDGVFVVELFLKNYFVGLREKGDLIFDNPLVYNGILHDMLLFENQLPFRFLHSLYDSFVLNKVDFFLDKFVAPPPSFHELAQKYFKDVGNTRKLLLERDFLHVRHFVEFLSVLQKPDDTDQSPKQKVGRGVNFDECSTATELRDAGVKFRPGTENRVRFDIHNGVLTIPGLKVLDSTETFYSNLIAYEQSGCHHKYTSSYIILLGNLMKTPKDVGLLIDSGIICNEYGSSKKVAELFSRLYKDLVVNQQEFRFASVCYRLNIYNKTWWHILTSEILKLTPTLKAIGVIAIVTVFLTLVSTVCSIVQVSLKI